MATESVSDRVRALARYRGIDESEVINKAVEAGLESLYRDMVIGQYLDGDISRSDAVEELGVDTIKRIESARDAVEDDVEWGLHA